MPNQTRTAVIVEDDPDVRHLLEEVLESAGFSTVSVGNGIDGVRAVLSYSPLITTLDVNMPGIDGMEAARRIRAQSDTYIIMISAQDDEADIVLGLSAGADEYIAKPFRPREFRARVEAMLRRPRVTTPRGLAQDASGPSFPGVRPITTSIPIVKSAASGTTSPTPVAAPAAAPGPAPESPAAEPITTIAISESVPESQPETLTAVTSERLAAPVPDEAWIAHRDLRVDPDTRIAVLAGSELDLTRTEFDLLQALMESKRRVRSKADLTLVLRGESYVTTYFVGEADKRAIEAHMTNLRRKLGDTPTNPRYIETVRGVGYRMTAESAFPV